MEISVKNFGPIKYGSIDLSKRFYVFVGHNNSGKTYMANLVWGMNNFDFKNPLDAGFMKEYSELFPKYDEKQTEYTVSEGLISAFNKYYSKIILDNLILDLRIGENDFIIKKYDQKINFELDNFRKQNIKSTVSIFGENPKLEFYTLEKKRNSYDIIFQPNYDFLSNGNYPEDFYVKKGFNNILFYDEKINLQKILNHGLVNLLSTLIKEKPLNNLRFLPANRIFYPSFYRYIYESAKNDNGKINDEIIKENPSIEKIKALSKRPYTKAMDDLLGKIYWLKGNEKPNENYTDLLQKLRKLIGGEIVVKNAEGIGLNEFKLKMDSGEELDLYLSSSAANQLTTLYLYLKYWVSDGDNFLIMDEPEENLHPKHQIALLDILMQFANRNNNRVLITTHSSLLAESVNNHIQIGKLQDLGEDVERIVRENGLDISLNENLRPNDFGVYFFGNQTIMPYEVDDYGVFFRDFKQEEDKVASIAQMLSNEIYYSLEKDKTVLA